MMKRIGSLILALALVLGLCACGKSAQERWQEQYDLGMKYLSELNYEEAVAAFTEAISIDAKRPEAYIGRGDAYVGIGTDESLAAAQGDYESALALDNTLENAWLGLINTYILRGDYEGAQRALEQALAVLDPALLQEQQAELARLTAPEPGSEEYLQAAAAHLAPAVDFDFAINGVPLATADIYAIAAAVGARVESPANDGNLSIFYGPFTAFQFSWSKYVDMIWLLDVLGRAEDVTIWPSEYFAGIAPTDTLDQALEKLGFTAEERTWLATCTRIELFCQTDGAWRLTVTPAGEGSGPQQECQLILGSSNNSAAWISYSFEYAMEKAGLDDETPVDGRAKLKKMQVGMSH